MINIAVVEDTASDAKTLTEYVERAAKELGETCKIAVFDHAVSFLEGYRGSYDIVFMDIELPDIDGMETAMRLRAVDPDVILIFVTNMAQYAVKGYAVDAMDFMIKPVSYDNLKLKLSRAINRMERHKDAKLVIQGKTGAQVVSIPSIRYIEVLNHKLTFNTTDGEVTAVGALSKIEDRLKGFPFSRCNKCYLVNLDYVTGVDDFTAFLGSDSLVISRSRKKQFFKDIADHLGGV